MTTTWLRPAGSSHPAGRMPVLVAMLAVATIAAGGALVVRGTRAASHAPAAGAAVARPDGIEGLQARLRAIPTDWQGWAALGSAYVQQARIGGDPTYYPKAEAALRRSLSLHRTSNADALMGMGALAAARHDFAAALRYGEQARTISPSRAAIYGVIGDALIELGRYPQAFAALQTMVNLRPDLSSYARASYAWELQGNVANATGALKLALQAAASPNDAAFASYYLGELSWNAGDLGGAMRWYRQAQAHDAGFVPALQGIAKVHAARGEVATAIHEYTTVVDRLPLPQYVIELGDLYGVAGMRAQARDQYALLSVQEQLFKANGVNIDIEQALFDADHHVRIAAGLAAARREWSKRHSVFVADALAWALYANGRFREALMYSGRAMRLGTRSALFAFHRGMIERALGMRAAARADVLRALAINPHFSTLWSPKVAGYASALR